MQNSHITTTVKSLCQSKGISVVLLLQECDLTKSFIYDLEKRGTSPSCEKITKIANYFNVSVDYLLGRTNDPVLHQLPDDNHIIYEAARKKGDGGVEITDKTIIES